MPPLARSLAVLMLLGFTAICRGHGELDELITDASAAIARNPKDADLYLRRAELYRLHGEWGPAEADYQATRQLAPALGVVDLGLGEVRLGQGRDAEALTYFDRFIAANPDHAGARALRAPILERRGEWQAASDDLAAAMKSSPEPQYASTRAELLLRHREIDAAIQCLDEASQAHGGIPVLEQRALEVEEEHGLVKQALRRLNRIIAHDPRPDLWLARKAQLLARSGRSAEAHEAWQKAYQAFQAVPEGKRTLKVNRTVAAEITAGLSSTEAAHQ